MGIDLSRYEGLGKDDPDPNDVPYYDPDAARHLRINNAIKQLKYPGGYQRLFERMCKTTKSIDPNRLQVNNLLQDLERRNLKLWKFWAERGIHDKMEALRTAFDLWAQEYYGESWEEFYKVNDIMVDFICALIKSEFPIDENITEQPIIELAIILPEDVVDKLIEEELENQRELYETANEDLDDPIIYEQLSEQEIEKRVRAKLINKELRKRERKRILPGGLGRVEFVANGPPKDVTSLVTEYSRPLAIGVEGNANLLKINPLPLVNQTLNRIFNDTVIDMGFNKTLLEVCLAVSLMIGDMTGYYTNFYSKSEGENTSPDTNLVISKFSHIGEFDIKPYDSKSFHLFYKCDKQEDNDKFYAYGGKFVPDKPFELKDGVEIPNDIPLNFNIHQRNVENLFYYDQYGRPEIYEEGKPSIFIDGKDNVYPRKEVSLKHKIRILAGDMGLFTAYLTAVMAALDRKSKIQYRTDLELQPSTEHINYAYSLLHEEAPYISPEEQKEILERGEAKRIAHTLAPKYISSILRMVAFDCIEAMLYMGIPLGKRMNEKGISIVWDINTIIKYFSLFPDRFVHFRAQLSKVERKRKEVEFAKYIKSDPIKMSFKEFIDNPTNTREIVLVLSQIYNVPNNALVTDAIEEVKKLAEQMDL